METSKGREAGYSCNPGILVSRDAQQKRSASIPAIDIGHDIRCASFPMDEDQVFFYPTHEVVFKGPFDDLVEEVGGEEFMDISTRETCGKRLRAPSVNTFQT